mmetsp:Transcript_1878/g.3276  ORF Transcript_1878/g.3276 Transcript_1878/m.3276 type:complete len:81 (-) Transcript_1878:3-245(-)
MRELAYLILFIFSIGPLRVFLKIKEGKTNLRKIVEDYEDERGFIRPQERKGVGLLPTSSRPTRRANAAKESSTESSIEMN